ncbi:transferase [Syncephalis pseudoplumigaleata]|uniref:Transferase n=1 Tax=Syncephalis pseudoplumigaleata TaxID=1712513 RepID=A0A4V1J123_9FUNG|nr:transferase [Syncephalis pseudoplumigaleata]|eukprot:RKP23559.1 transferase [Syncephalis pseudoplumigaleata]
MSSAHNTVELWIKPEGVSDDTIYQLSDADYVHGPKQLQTLVVYYNSEQRADFMPTDRLVAGLRKTIDQYPILAGRLKVVNDVDYEVHMTGEGVLYQETQSKHDIASFDPNWPNSSMLPELLALPWSTDTDIIFALRVTRFANNSGVILAGYSHHNVIDGLGFLMVGHAWAAFTRGETPPPPLHDRELLRLPPELRHMVKKPSPEMFKLQSMPAVEDHSKWAVMLEMNAENLTRLKTAAIESVRSKEESKEEKAWFSTSDAVIAMLWRALVRSSRMKPHERVNVVTGINMRGYLTDLPANYFGNAIDAVIVSTTVGELIAQPLGEIALMQRRALLATKQRTREEWLRWANSGNALSAINRCIPMQPGTSIGISDLTKASAVVNLDFGYGNMAALRRIAHPAKITNAFFEIPPCPKTGKRGIVVSAMVKKEDYDRFVNDYEIAAYTRVLDTKHALAEFAAKL